MSEQQTFEIENDFFVEYNGVRTDIHRPSVIDPSDYAFVAFECIKIEAGDIGACFYQQAQREIIRNHMAHTGGTYSSHSHGGNCRVCGNANAIYTVLFYHEKTNTYVRMGDTCAQKTDMAFSNAEFNRFRTAINDAREAQAGKKK